MASRTACRSGASSRRVELTKTRSLWSGVRIIACIVCGGDPEPRSAAISGSGEPGVGRAARGGIGHAHPRGMTEQLQRDPDDWKTGDEPMTEAQRSYLTTLSAESGEEVSEN